MLGACTLIFLMAMLLVSALDAFFAQRSAEHVQNLQALNGELEMRTAELSRVNALLNQEVQVRTKAQDALRAARDELETRVTERTTDRSHVRRNVAEQALRVSEQQLRRLFEERERLVRDLHDNTVQAIYAAGLRLELVEQLSQEDPARAASQVAAAIEYLNGAIRDIRRYIDRPAEQTSATPLRDSLAKLVEASRPDSGCASCWTVDPAVDERLTPDEAEHVLQIAREAMSNSLRHSRAMQATVTIGLTNDGVTLEIKDDGIGFDPTMLKQEKRRPLQHEGASAADRCSTRGPVCTGERHAYRLAYPQRAKAPMKPQDSRPVQVLLVDDHDVVREGLRAIFSRAGIEVVGEAGTVAEAIEEAARLDPDVVLMDVRLPDGSGVTACREIRAANPRISVLFLTAFADDSALLATAFASAGGYLLKEIGAEHLIQAIKSGRGKRAVGARSERRAGGSGAPRHLCGRRRASPRERATFQSGAQGACTGRRGQDQQGNRRCDGAFTKDRQELSQHGLRETPS